MHWTEFKTLDLPTAVLRKSGRDYRFAPNEMDGFVLAIRNMSSSHSRDRVARITIYMPKAKTQSRPRQRDICLAQIENARVDDIDARKLCTLSGAIMEQLSLN